MINVGSCNALYREMICYTMLEYFLPQRTVLHLKRLSHCQNSFQLRTLRFEVGDSNWRAAANASIVPSSNIFLQPTVICYSSQHLFVLVQAAAQCDVMCSKLAFGINLVARKLTPRLGFIKITPLSR